MCQAFSCLITKSKKVYWKEGVDSHDELRSMYVKKDKELKDDKEPPNNTFARIEIVPKNGNYLDLKHKWVYKIDERIKPKWLNKSYEKPCREAWKKWKDKVYKSFNLKEVLHPVHPFKIKPPKKITKKHLDLLREWNNVWDSFRNSVGNSVTAYIGSLFPNIKKWKYTEEIKIKGYPFKSAVKLWKMGLVPSYDSDSKVWRLYGGENARILWEGRI